MSGIGLKLGVVLLLVAVFLDRPTSGRLAAAQEAPVLLKVDLVVTGSFRNSNRGPTEVLLYLPDEATSVTISHRPLFPEGDASPLVVTIYRWPFSVPLNPLVEDRSIDETTTLTIPELGSGTYFVIENPMTSDELLNIPNAMDRLSQVVTLEVR